MQDFITAAAEIYRQTGDPAAVAFADLLGRAPGVIEPVETHAPAVMAHFGTALGAVDADPVLSVGGVDLELLDWHEAGWAPDMPASFIGRYAYVEMVGPDGMVREEGFRFGLYLQAPETYYPRHWHTAEELYFVLSGMAEWQQGERPAEVRRPGAYIRHGPDEPHAMRTFGEPLLAMWGWVGDLRVETYRIENLAG